MMYRLLKVLCVIVTLYVGVGGKKENNKYS